MYKQAGTQFYLGIILGVILLGIIALAIGIGVARILISIFVWLSVLLG